MAKIDILFNDINYSIDNSSLSAADAYLQSHLSTVMNGSGATIRLGGTTYSIDSTKLTNATNEFTSHLRTVSGSGYKVKVGGVEYGVDSNKMTGAVSELETVLGGLKSDKEYKYLDVIERGQYQYKYLVCDSIDEFAIARMKLFLHNRGIECITREEILDATAVVMGYSSFADSGMTEMEFFDYFGAGESSYNQYKATGEISNGWNVVAIDKTLTNYDAIPDEIDGIPVVDMNSTFKDCANITIAPTIPSSVTIMRDAFANCTNLKTYVGSADADGDFSGYVIPSNVWSMNYIFSGCANMVIAPAIPNAAVNMEGAFKNCTNLTTAPTIPSSVVNIDYAFDNCTSLTGEIEINATNLITFTRLFRNTTKTIKLTGTCDKLSKIASQYSNVTVQ